MTVPIVSPYDLFIILVDEKAWFSVILGEHTHRSSLRFSPSNQ